MVGFGLVGFGLVGFGLVGFGLVGFGLVGFGLVGFGLVGFGLVGFDTSVLLLDEVLLSEESPPQAVNKKGVAKREAVTIFLRSKVCMTELLKVNKFIYTIHLTFLI